MKVLLTGASGLLGHNVLHHLMAERHQVVAAVRNIHSLHITPNGLLTIAPCDYSTDTLSKLATGCEAIVNCAGTTAMHLRHLADYEEANISLPKKLVQVMEQEKIKKMVHVSTVNTIGYGTAAKAADEDCPTLPPFTKSLYAISKKAGEEVVLECARRHKDWHLVVVNPGFMLGPMDARPSSGRMLAAAYRHPFMVAPDGGKAFVDVRDVAQTVVAALDKGRNGARYIAVNSKGHLSIKELYKMQARVMGYRQRVAVMPDGLLLAAGKLGDAIRALGIDTELCTNNIKQLLVHEHYDNRRAVSELGLTETPLEQSIADFHSWRKEQEEKKHRI